MDLLNSKMLMIIFTLLTYGFNPTLCFHFSKFVSYNTPMRFLDAYFYCRDHHKVLATMTTMDENKELAVHPGGSWFGLSDEPAYWKDMSDKVNSWKWSVDDMHNDGGYQKWMPNQPDHFNASDHCVLMGNGEWDDASCDNFLPFVCLTESTDPKTYMFISTTMTWDEARSHCRDNYIDLATIMSDSENTAVASVIPTNQNAWIGLFREPWGWYGPIPSFSNWAPGEPNNYNDTEHCALIDTDGLWRDADCSLPRPFSCLNGDLWKKVQHAKLTLQTSANLLDPMIYSQIVQQLEIKFALKGVTDFKLTLKLNKTKTT